MIVGLDLGTRRVAAACPEVGWSWRSDTEHAADSRAFPDEWQAGNELGSRLLQALILDGLLPRDRSRRFYFERPIGRYKTPNPRTLAGQCLSAGALLAHIMPVGTITSIEQSSLWKKELIGDGSAGKPECRAWLEAHHPALAAVCGKDKDLVDAHCIALWAALAPPG